MDTPKISIVVPAYNAKLTLRRCVDSVLSQTFDDWELIIVNDGSKDETASICELYSGDSRIKSFHKENGGVSSARNFGIEKASGEWICFLDADDEFESDFLSYFFDGRGEDEFQLSFFTEYISEYDGVKSVNHVGDAKFFPKEEFKSFLTEYIDSPILKAVHSNFFLTAIVKEKNIRFNSRIRAGEDHAFVLEYLQYVDAAKVIKGNGYVYYLPYSYSLKYGSKLEELKYKSDLMEVRVDAISKKYDVDLSIAKRDKWRHSLSNIDVMDLYDDTIFEQYLDLYNSKCAMDYKKDAKCNREARTASMLLQLAQYGGDKYQKQYDELMNLLSSRISEKNYDSSSFPKTTKLLLKVASLKSFFLMKVFCMLSNNFKRYLLNFGIFRWMQSLKRFAFPVENNGSNNTVICDCKTSKRMDYHISIFGNNNVVKIAPSCQLYDTGIVVSGDNNVLEIDDEVKIQKGVIKVYGGAKFHIGHNTTFQEIDANVTKEDVIIGDDCLFSYGIVIRNYDGHKIVDATTNEICNPPGKIVLHDHVWVSQNVIILKDVEIGENAIVGVGAIVTKSIPSGCIAAGIPAKVIKDNRNWIRH